MTLVTLAQIKAELKADNTTTGQDANLMRMARKVTSTWRKLVGMEFEPLYRTKRITANGMNVGGGGQTLLLGEPLLEVASIDNNGTALVYGTNVNAYPLDDRNPINMLMLDDCDCLSWYAYCAASPYNTISVTGWWGMRSNYSTEGWIDSNDANVAAITDAAATTFAVTSATGLDALYRTPRFSPGNLIKIDNEIMEIDNVSTNTLTVRRGQRGTTAATHLISTAISVWNPEMDVVEALTRWACYNFARKGSFEVAMITDLGRIEYPSNAPNEVREIAQEYANGY